MDTNKNTSVPTPEELAAEQAALAEKKEDEIRANIISEYGFDEVDDAERIDKLVNREVENSKKLSAAIGQKIKYRTALQQSGDPKPVLPAQDPSKALDPDVVKKTAEQVIAEQFEKRDLQSLDYPDEIKNEIQKIAKALGVGVLQAARDPYIVYKISEYEKQQKIDEATISRTNRTGSRRQFSLDEPPEVDMSTEEGRKTWDEWKIWAQKQGA